VNTTRFDSMSLTTPPLITSVLPGGEEPYATRPTNPESFPRDVLQDHLRPQEFGRLLYGHYRLQARAEFSVLAEQRPADPPAVRAKGPPRPVYSHRPVESTTDSPHASRSAKDFGGACRRHRVSGQGVSLCTGGHYPWSLCSIVSGEHVQGYKPKGLGSPFF
jgi:hypothetical protein